jgi:hypothetical protein
MKASEYFKKGVVNYVSQKHHEDGSITVTIYKQGWKKSYKFKVKNLYQANEQILEDEEIKE